VIRRLWAFARQHAGLATYLADPGDGRVAPVIPARAVVTAALTAYLLRDGAFHAVEALVRAPSRRALGLRRVFSDDTVAYVTERLSVPAARAAAVTLVRQAKRRKAFDDTWLIGLVLDGTTVGACLVAGCPWCHPVCVPHRLADGTCGPIGTVVGQQHKLSLVSVVGRSLAVPVDVEPYGPSEGELTASQRLLARTVAALGRRFADYVVVDALYATAPFLHEVGDLGLAVVVRLKDNVPTLVAQVDAQFGGRPPHDVFTTEDGDRVELWDADDFLPWEGLRWPAVRVVRSRQTRPDGTVVTADWVTDLPTRRVRARTLYRLGKTRWTVENQGFNDAKTRYGLDHVPHHHANSLLLHWLWVVLTLTLERLFRLRYLHRGTHPPLSAITLLRRLRLSLGGPVLDTS